MKATARIARLTPFKTAVSLGLMILSFASSSSRAADAAAFQPLDLTALYNDHVRDMTNNAGFPAWKSAAVGHQVFRTVPFDIGGVIYLWGTGKSTTHTSSFPALVSGIAANRKFQTLYVCDGSYYKSPDDTPVFAVVFHYDDGSTATNTLRYADDILDWKVGRSEVPVLTPTATNSMIAWTGGVFSPAEKQPLRYCMTALDNPHPDLTVTTIDLSSFKSRTIAFVLGLTTGPTGGMSATYSVH